MAIKAPPPAQQQEDPNFPPGQVLSFDKFQGVNTDTTRPGVPDEQAYWLDGWMPFGPRQIRTMPGAGVSIFTAPVGTYITCFFSFSLSAVPYLGIFPSDGSVWVVNTTSLVSTKIANAGTITSPSRTAIGTTQYGAIYWLITTDTMTNGYFGWDGTTFYTPGSPFGLSTWPTAINGSAIQTYQGRVWLANGPIVTFSAPGSVNDFATLDGGGSFISSDSFLQAQFTGLVQTNGFLYLIGDSSVNYISGVVTSGSPLVTTFTNQNADPECGSVWPGTIGTWSRNTIFSNAFGVQVSYGAAVTKISENLDGVYTSGAIINLGHSFAPSACKATVFNKKLWLMLANIVDPVAGPVNKLLIWDGKKWWASLQNVSLSYIAGAELNSVFLAYGTDGTNIYPLFTTPSTAFTKTAVSKLWDQPGGFRNTKAVNRIWGAASYNVTGSQNLTVAIDSDAGASASVVIPGPGTATGKPVVFGPLGTSQQGTLLGMTITTNCSDVELIAVEMAAEIVQYRG
jgi:hypothetical protein